MKKTQLFNSHKTTESNDLKILNCNLPVKLSLENYKTKNLIISNELDKTYSKQKNCTLVDKAKGHKEIKDSMSKSLLLLKKNRKNSKKQKFKKDFLVLESQIAKLSPQNHLKAIAKTQDFNTLSIGQRDQKSPSKKSLRIIQTMNYSTNNSNSISPFIQIQTQQYEMIQSNCTNNDLFEKFNKIIEANYQNKNEFSLEIESKFIEVKKLSKLESSKMLPWAQEDIIQSHQQLLEQENKYLRENLIQFTQIITSQRNQLAGLKEKYKYVKKEHFKNIKDKENYYDIIKQLQKQVDQKDPIINSMQQIIQQYSKYIKTLQKKKTELQQRFQALQTQYEQFQERFSSYRFNKEKQIENLLDQKQKQKNQLQEMIYDKHKQIEELNLYLQKHTNKKSHKNEELQTDTIVQDDKDLQESESICLSLADAQSLKYIIQDKQLAHRQEITALNNYHQEQKQKYLNIIDKLTQTVKVFEIEMQSTIESIYQQNQSIDQSCLKDFQLQDQTPKYFLSQQFRSQLKTMHYGKRIKKLYNTLSEERKQKISLIQKIASLQQNCLNVQKQQDEELEQLFQKCVNELQKQKQINMKLSTENINLKSKLNIMYGQSQKYSRIQF